MPGPKFQCPDIYRRSHLTVSGQCLQGTEPKNLCARRKISVLGHPFTSSPALDGTLDGTLDDVLDGGLDGALHGKHYFAMVPLKVHLMEHLMVILMVNFSLQ